jgi:hypothetical protein
LGWSLNTFESTFTQKTPWMDSHSCFNFAFISHKVTLHVELHICRNPNFGLVTKAKGVTRVWAKRSPGVTSHTPGNVGKCEGVNPHTPKATPTLGDGVSVDFQNFRERFQGYSMACSFLYINGKLLQLRCLKWACIIHLDIWNTSYGQKKGRKSNCQFDSRPEKVGNRPDLLSCRQCATYRWKVLDKSYNFALNRTLIQGLIAKLRGSKVAGVLVGAISGLPFRSPGRENPFRCGPLGEVQNIL